MFDSKQILIIFTLLLIPYFVCAESKIDIARDIFLSDGEFTTRLQKLEEEMASNREMILGLYKPKITYVEIPSDITALEEQLYIELINTNIFYIDTSVLEKLAIQDLANFLTENELLELRELQKKPLFMKLKQLDEAVMVNSKKYMSKWKEENESLLNDFHERSEKITQLKKEFLEQNAKESKP
ncbi:MAG: hypothetical protein N0C84_02295 [Candidatus Thiodiazotropha taylori]|uniref:Uncharacterized protein n=1 Tax=Candidatus Thiodiazotropha taylori TaxID=2792791 RepID=A0A9E4N2Y8_9GAMM|nr:hypothetical protein [Candidatus Thiodiazotropha taylori]MCW4255278.1 hypothetical protein [Candidatus Thiodiazotropha taylori]